MSVWYWSEKRMYYTCVVPFQMQFYCYCLGPLIYFPYSDLYLTKPETDKERERQKKTTATESYSHSFYFYSLTVIKDNSSSNCLTRNGPTLCLGAQTF